jgi:ribosomal protein L11 methyltransferase
MVQESWLEISLITDGEMSEAVAEALSRYIPDGVVIESTAIDTSALDTVGKPVGPLRVSGYIKNDPNLEDTKQKIEQALWYLGRIRPLPKPEYKMIYQKDWSESWKRHYKPIAIGKNLIIIPAWIENPSANRIPIRIEPGMAFGTGTHPTTQLCLEMLDMLFYKADPFPFSDLDGEMPSVIDLGCGSGILSIAAVKLGAKKALGVDIDQQAIQSAHKNAVINSVEQVTSFYEGSLSQIIDGEYFAKKAPIVLVNILAVVIIQLLDDGLGHILTEDGFLILSGILEEQLSSVRQALERNKLEIIHLQQQDDWVGMVVKQKSPIAHS